jgi:hypothetical protein
VNKKKQKNFMTLRHGLWQRQRPTQEQKSFCFFFFRKRRSSLLLGSGRTQCKIGAQGCRAILLQQFPNLPVDPAAI